MPYTRYLKTIASAASAAALVLAFSCPPAIGEGFQAMTTSALEASSAESDAASASSSASAGAAEASSASAADSAASAAASADSSSDASADGQAQGQAGASEEAANSQKQKEEADASKKQGKSSKTSNASKKAKAEAKKEAEERAKKKAEKEKDADSDEPKASGEDPVKYAKKIPALVSQLEAVPDEFGEAKDVARAYKAKISKLDKRTAKLQKERERAQNVLDEMQSELAQGENATLTMVLTGRADFDSIDSRAYLLQKVADGSSARIAEIDAELSKLEKRKSKLQKAEKREVKAIAAEHEEATAASIAKGNALAAKIERNVSLMRYAEPDSTKARAALRKSALAAVASWYEFEDSLAGREDVLTFGAGADFQMNKKAFVKKWGDAIDAFYAEHYPGAPLEGHGAEMAEAAWEHGIDPRLCAAVSIVESTGGQYCIKSCNAWGWGAADSDPYGGASSWGSWAEAIQAWHEGIAGSTTGLATAATVEEFGEIYCSTLDWAAKVAGEMQKISAEAV